MLRFHAAAAAGAVVATLAASAAAQVNVEPLRAQLKDSGVGARVAGSITSYAGNTQGIIFGSAGLVGARIGKHFMYLSLSGDYARLNQVVTVAKWFGHARHNYQLADALWWEEFAQLESDRFRRVSFRQLLGTGPRVRLLGTTAVDVFYGAAYMLEHTDLETRETESEGEGMAHRFSNYAAVTLRAHPKIVVTSVTYAQPRFDAFRDLKLLNVSQADFQITGRLHSRIDVTLRYDSVGPRDVSRADLELKNSLELVF